MSSITSLPTSSSELTFWFTIVVEQFNFVKVAAVALQDGDDIPAVPILRVATERSSRMRPRFTAGTGFLGNPQPLVIPVRPAPSHAF